MVSFLLSCRFQELNTDHEVQWQAFSPAEPKHWIFFIFFFNLYICECTCGVCGLHVPVDEQRPEEGVLYPSTLLLQGRIYP